MTSRRFAVVVVTLALVAAACGSSSSSGGSGTHGGGKSDAEPIKIGVLTSIDATTVTHTDIPKAAKVAAAAVNAAGGVGGRPIKLYVCDDHYTEQGASLCAQKLLMQDKVLLLAGGDGGQDAAVVPILDAAHTISWGDVGASDESLRNDRVYILQPVIVQYRAIPAILPKGTKRVAYISADAAVAQTSRKSTEAVFPKSIKFTDVDIGLSATSFQTQCQTIKNAHDQAAIVAINPAQISTLIGSCKQLGLDDLLWIMPSVVIDEATIDVVTKMKVPNLAVMSYSQQAFDGFTADLAKYGKSVGVTKLDTGDPAIGAWLSVKLLPQLIKAAGGPDATKIKSYLDRVTAFSTGGATPPIDFTKTPISIIPRVKNVSPYPGKIQAGKLVVSSTRPLTVAGS